MKQVGQVEIPQEAFLAVLETGGIEQGGVVMVTVVDGGRRVSVPDWVTDINAFRRWMEDNDLPEEARAWWLKGEVWIDMSGEQIFTHARLKLVISTALEVLTQGENLGIMLPDGVMLSNFAGDISGKPDGLFLANETWTSDRVRLIEGKDNGYTELQGTPDMVLEVLSKSSEEKDEVILKRAYWEADIREYWLVDVRHGRLRFDIFRHTARGYVATRKQEGWVKSNVFGKSFRLLTLPGPGGHPNYRLEVR
jgi:Uma2 family endonuclease